MAEVSAVSGSTSTYRDNNVPTSDANASMKLSDFYKLLAAQLQYQDPDNPMDTSEMMGTMVQTQMIESITQMTAMSTTTYAASMVGKQVTVAEVDKDGKYKGDRLGEVTSVVFGDNPIIFIGKDAYALNQIVAVGDEIPKPDPDDGSGSGSTEKPKE